MTVEGLRTELEKITTGLASSDFTTIDPETIEKLEKLAFAADGLGMKKGMHLIKNLLSFLKAVRDGKSKIEDSGNLRLTALDFYLKKLSGSGKIEDI